MRLRVKLENILGKKITRDRLIKLLRFLDRADTRQEIVRQKLRLTTKRR